MESARLDDVSSNGEAIVTQAFLNTETVLDISVLKSRIEFNSEAKSGRSTTQKKICKNITLLDNTC